MLAARWELVGKHKSREHCRRDCVTRATVAEAIDVEYVTAYPTQTAHGGLSSFSFSNFVPQALYKRTAIGGLRSPVSNKLNSSRWGWIRGCEIGVAGSHYVSGGPPLKDGRR